MLNANCAPAGFGSKNSAKCSGASRYYNLSAKHNVAGETRLLKLRAQLLRNVGGHSDAPMAAAMRHMGSSGHILRAQEFEFRGAGHALKGRPNEIPGRILDADHVFAVMENARQRIDRDVHDKYLRRSAPFQSGCELCRKGLI